MTTLSLQDLKQDLELQHQRDMLVVQHQKSIRYAREHRERGERDLAANALEFCSWIRADLQEFIDLHEAQNFVDQLGSSAFAPEVKR